MKYFFILVLVLIIDSCSYDSTIIFYVENNCSTDITIVTMSLDSIPETIDQIILEPNTRYQFGENYYSNDSAAEAMNDITTIKYGKRYHITKGLLNYKNDLSNPDIYSFESNGKKSGISTLILTDKDF